MLEVLVRHVPLACHALLLGDDELDGVLGAELHARGIAVAEIALLRLAGTRVDRRGSEGTDLDAGAAAQALVGVDHHRVGLQVAAQRAGRTHRHAQRHPRTAGRPPGRW